MKPSLFSKHKFLSAIFFVGIFLNFVVWILFWKGLDFNRTALILHYNVFLGIDNISINASNNRFLEVFFVPLSSLIATVLNYVLGFFLVYFEKKQNKNLELSTASLGGYFIFVAGTVLQILVLVYAVAIVLVNK